MYSVGRRCEKIRSTQCSSRMMRSFELKLLSSQEDVDVEVDVDVDVGVGVRGLAVRRVISR